MANRYIVHDETGKPVKGHELGDGLYSIADAAAFVSWAGKRDVWAIARDGYYVWPTAKMGQAVNG